MQVYKLMVISIIVAIGLLPVANSLSSDQAKPPLSVNKPVSDYKNKNNIDQKKIELEKSEAQVNDKPALLVEEGCEQYRHLVERYQWDKAVAMAVMEAESTQNGIHCNPSAANMNDVHKDINGNVICIGSFGLFQISCHSGQVYDPEKNVEIAWQKYQARGWQPWGAYTSGLYLKYLK